MRKSILIVDDDELTLMLTENILSGQYHTLRAMSGEEAIKVYGEFHPDMILADYMMPEMNGFEMVKKLREQYGRRIPVIFMTANEDEETEFESFSYGAVDFIRKPLKADVLLKSINSIMDRLAQAN